MELRVDRNRTSGAHRTVLFVSSCLLIVVAMSLGLEVATSAAQQNGPGVSEEKIDVIADQLSVGNQGQTIEASGNV